MTTKMLTQIEQLAREGWCDTEISRRTGRAIAVVRYWRTKVGIPRGRKGNRNLSAKRYAVYDGKTTQFVIEGDVRECAEYMGIKVTTFRNYKWKFEQGRYKKYEIYEVEE